MIPKEKAKELFDKMYLVDDIMGNYPMCFDTAKKCALIAVNEVILSIIEIHNGMTWSERKQTIERNTGYSYWSNVKKEIEKL